MKKQIFRRLVSSIILAGAAVTAYATEITGAGSTFVYPILSKWADSGMSLAPKSTVSALICAMPPPEPMD